MKLFVFKNLGNTCYLNSVLQSFINNTTLQELIQQYDLPFINELKKIKVDLSDNGEYNAVIHNIKEILEFFSFRRFEQQDAHECIIEFLELLVKESPYEGVQQEINNSWDKLNTSPFVPMYYGQTKTYISCLKCKNVKTVLEEFNSINLNVPVENVNLTDLFVKYLEKETNDDANNLYYCDICKCSQAYQKKITLNRLPKVLILVLKRYTVTGNKILSEVSFEEKLKIRESCSGKVNDYRLTSIINHTGNLYNGHYTNYSIINGKCLLIDDEIVSVQKYNYKNAYILFYKVN
jgi:ubiquitin C-terminal hydrolase